MFSKRIKILFLILLFVFLFLLIFSRGKVYNKDELDYGVTFSKKHANSLGLDWKKSYLAILDDLGVKKLRLAGYWDEIEPAREHYNWEDLDWQVNEAGNRGAEIILALGGRLPRWPECHWPAWAENLSKEEREQSILNYISAGLERYKKNPYIKFWQIENEPFLAHFGDCPELDKSFLEKEIALVKSTDSKPIILTDSGELSLWVPAASRADIFGTTMYRDTYSKFLGRYVHYPIGPSFFKLKKNLASIFANPKEWLVIELQAEPWGPKTYTELSQEERNRTMNLTKFKEILEFSRQAGFQKFYLWGVEWWYWEKEKQNNPALWEEARLLFKPTVTEK